MSNGKKTIRFDLALVLGDNLGVNSILGFVEGFNATYFCRFCLSKRSEIHKVTDEKNCELRSEENYFDLLNVNVLSGIVQDCVFNHLVSFHATKHPSIDVMHDIVEGICRRDVASILDDFINEKHFSHYTI